MADPGFTPVAVIAAMVTPALFILGAASLVASALVRMARVVDRARALAVMVHEASWGRSGTTPEQLRIWLRRHATRARYAGRSIALLYAAIVVFIATCLALAADPIVGPLPGRLPLALAVTGTLLLLAGAAWMVAESRLSGAQIAEEIQLALVHLEGTKQ
jgi:hypothetical protein